MGPRETTLVAWALILALASVASADGSDGARAHYEKGLSAYALEHYAEAAEEYEQAFSLKADSALLYNAAQAHRLAGNNERALRLYQSYLRIFGKRATNTADVKRHIGALEAALESERKAQSSPPTEVAEPSPPEKPSSEPPPPVVLSSSVPQLANIPLLTTPPAAKPLYKKAWFWGVVVGAAAAVGLGVGLGVGLSSPRNPSPSFGATTVQP
jgi:tetratricopeptide (TPR) repeat protein